MGKFEVWLRDTLAVAEKHLAEAGVEARTSPAKHSRYEMENPGGE